LGSRFLCVLGVPGGKLVTMDVDSIRAYCMSFPQATENLQWGEDLCFKVRGKIFAIVGLDSLRLCFKCTPETFAEMIEREDIRPARYVGRYKWVMLDRLDALRSDELEDLVRQSYEMVVAKAPKARAQESAPRKEISRKKAIRRKTRTRKR